jgi:hypothetical protein
MKIIYAREALEKSIFLAGPSPRDQTTESWRPMAMSKLQTFYKFDGIIYNPEARNYDEDSFNYDNQIHWEWEALNMSTVVVFWVPRNMVNMPAFTTNVEFGLYAATGKCLFGAPPEAPKNNYLRALAQRNHVECFTDIDLLLERAVEKCEEPF